MAAIDQQLKRLQTDYIDVYQVHRLDPHTPMEETMYSLDQIVRSGKVRYIGGSTMPAYKFAQMIMIADWKGYARPIAMQNLYNMIQREEEREMNRLCHEQGVGLIPYSPLARGFLAGNRSKEGGGATERSKNDAQVQAGTYRDCDWEIVERLKKVAARQELPRPRRPRSPGCSASPTWARRSSAPPTSTSSRRPPRRRSSRSRRTRRRCSRSPTSSAFRRRTDDPARRGGGVRPGRRST